MTEKTDAAMDLVKRLCSMDWLKYAEAQRELYSPLRQGHAKTILLFEI